MRNNFKRFLGVALVLIMAFAVMTVSAFATEGTNVAKIGDTEYATLAAAMTEANKVAGDYTITMLKDSAEVFTFAQKNGVNITIDGEGNTFTGKITLNAGAGNLTITDATLVPTVVNTDKTVINSIMLNASTAPNLTIEDCVLKGSNKSRAIVYGHASNTANAVVVKNCEASDLQYIVSYRQTGSNSLLIENVTATDMIYLIRPLKCPEVTVKDVTCDAVIGIDVKNDKYGHLTLENVNINIVKYNGNYYTPVNGSGAGINYDITVKGKNSFTKDGVAFEGTTWFSGNAGYVITVEAPLEVAAIGTKKYATLADAVAAATAGDTITLLDDVTENVTIGKKLTIDGADFTYTGKMSVTKDITIKNVNFDGKNINDFDGDGNKDYMVETRSAYKVIIEDCTAKNAVGFINVASNNVSTTVKNVTVSGVGYGIKVDYSGAVVLENVDITASVAGVLNSNYGKKTITVKDSKINIFGTWTRNNTTKTTISFEGANTVDQFIIDANIDVFKLAEGATLTAPEGINVTTDVADHEVKYADGMYKLVETPKFAIGSKQYTTLADAVAAAKDKQTIKMLKDASGAGVVINKPIIIDFAGFTYTLTTPVGSTGTESNGFQILVGNKVTLKNGTLKVADEAADKFYILVQNYTDLTVTDMVLDGTNLDKYAFTHGDSYTLSNNSGKVTLNGKTKVIANNDGDMAFAFDACNFGGYALPTVTVTSTVEIVGNIEAPAKIGSVYYATFEQAVNSAKDKQTVVLLADASGAGVVIDADITVNFNGFTYTITSGVGSKGTESNGFQILPGNSVMLTGGTLTVADSAKKDIGILIQNYADLKVTNMTLSDKNLEKDNYPYVLSNNSGNVMINGSTKITVTSENGVAFDVCDYANYELPVVTVASTVKINGKIEAPAKISNVYYATFEAAKEAAAAGKTITLVDDMRLTKKDVVKTADGYDVMFNIDKNLTLDLNGKTIYVDYDNDALLYAVVYVANGVTLNVNDKTGKGGIELKTGATKAGKYDCVAYMFWKHGSTGRLNINGGNYHANNLEDSMVYTNTNCMVTINGGKFVLDTVGTEKNDSPWIFNAQGQNEKKIVINGGTFNADVFHQYWIFETKSAENLALKANGDGTYTVVEATHYVTEYYYYGKMYTKNVGYASLEEAEIAAAKNSEISKKEAKVIAL